MRGFACATVGVVVFGLGACSSPRKVPFPDHLQDYVTEPPNPGFSVYQEVAHLVEERCADLVWRASFTPGQKEAAMARCSPLWEKIREAQQDKIAFVFEPYPPLSPPVERRAWRFLGRVLVWQIEKLLQEKKKEQAISLFALGLRLGADLSGGDAMDADLGYTLMEDCLRVLWARFPELTPAQLRWVHRTVQEVILGMPSLELVLRHEQATMLRCVEAVQEWYLQGRLEELERGLGQDGSRVIRYLERLRSAPISEQVRFFEGFAMEARREIEYWVQEVGKPPHLWADPPQPSGERPWWRLARHFFGGARFLRRRWVTNQAWLRLFAVDSALYARVVQGSPLPADLSGFSPSLRTDPFSGADFLYYPFRGSYRLYSVGENGLDDGGVMSEGALKQDLLPLRE